ncbi:MAG: hypothetical protein HKN16_10420, partial [Saprospiraceae bacterium]|nr:hypothetical protein [Saprospiraceae bacterium]
MKQQALILTLLTFLSGSTLWGQGDEVPIGSWKNYLPFSVFNSLTQSEDQIFATSDLAVLAVDKTDFSKTFITKLNGLSSTGTRLVEYVPSVDGLIVVYQDSEFDLVLQNRTINFENIKVDGSFFNREVLDVSLLKEDAVYFCTAFGIVEFFPALEEFGFTLDLGVPVYEMAYKEGVFYAATEWGIIYAEDDPEINLKDVTNWTAFNQGNGFPLSYLPTHIVNYQEKIYFALDSVVYELQDNTIDTVLYEPGFNVVYLTAEGANLLVGLWCKDNCDGKMMILDGDRNMEEYSPSCVDRPRYALEDQYGQIWATDSWMYLRRSSVDDPGFCDKYIANQPFLTNSVEIALRDDEIWLTTNGISSTTYNPQFNELGLFARIDGTWRIFQAKNTPGLEGQDGLAYHRITYDPVSGNLYVGTNSDGMVIVSPENEFSYLSNGTSALDFGADPTRVRVAGIAVDEQGNVWMANNTATKPIVVLTPEGNTSNDFSNKVPIGSAIRDVVVDFSGFKWFTVDKNGLLVYDDNGTLNTPNDDDVRLIKTTNSQLPENRVRCIEVDLDGEVWVGTELGVVSFNCGTSAFEPQLCQGFKQIVEVDGFRANLLETEDVRAIAVDGANRKWFGTTNGVFLMSPDGKEQLAFFNSDN